MRLIRAFQSQKRILGGAAVLAVTQFAASVAGLVRDNLLNRTFPGLRVVDVYIAAFRPSDLLFQILIMAGFSVALVPLLARYRSSGDEQGMSALLNCVISTAALIFGGLALLLALAFPFLAPFFAQFSGPDLALYVSFGRLALLTNFLFVFGNAYGQYLNAEQRFWVYGLTPVLYTAGTVVGTVAFTPFVGPLGPMLGSLLGALIYTLWRLHAAQRCGYRPRLRWWHADLTEMGLLMIPRMLALGALQFELLFFDRIASGLSGGSIAVNAFARNFQSVVVGVTGLALSLSLFAPLSLAAAKQEWTRFRTYLSKGVLWMLLFTIPASIGLVLCTPVAAWLIHLAPAHFSLFLVCLVVYAVSIPFESLNHLYTRAYFAAKHTTLPAVLTVLNGTIAIVVAWIAAPYWGVLGLPVGYAVGHAVEMFGLLICLPGNARLLRAE